jgi:hypothetical protein
MKLVRIAIAAVVAVTFAFAGGAAHADDNKVKAVALFDEGLKAMKAGNYAKACKALDASNRLMSDSGTRGSLARCYTKLGRSASAWTLWRELADTAPTDDLREDAAAQAEKLAPRLAKYAIKVTAPAAGLTVTVAGEAIDTSIDVPVPIDPGTYPVEATAPGRVAWKGELTAAEGKAVVLTVPALAAVAAPPPEKPIRSGSSGRGRRIGGVVLVVGGLGGLGVGGGFAVLARRRNAEAKEICGGDIDNCEPTGTADAQVKIDDARLAANISTAAFIAGGALVATGVILYITAPKAERRAVSVAPLVDATTAGIALSGRY